MFSIKEMPMINPQPGDSRHLLPGEPVSDICLWPMHYRRPVLHEEVIEAREALELTTDPGERPVAIRVSAEKKLYPVCRMCLIEPIVNGRELSWTPSTRGKRYDPAG